MSKPIKAVYFLHNIQGYLLYVGKSINLHNRIRYHLEDKLEGSEWKVNIDRDNIQYVEIESDFDLDMYETYYINILKPPHNTSKVFCTNKSQLVLPDILQYKKTLPFFKRPKIDAKKIVEKHKKTTSFKDLVELYHTGSLSDLDANRIAPEIVEAYKLLGIKKMKALDYRRNKIKAALDELRPSKQNNLQQTVQAEFQPNTFYSLREIKIKLQAIYDSLQMSKKAKATDLNQWFTTTTKNVRNTNGLYITT